MEEEAPARRRSRTRAVLYFAGFGSILITAVIALGMIGNYYTTEPWEKDRFHPISVLAFGPIWFIGSLLVLTPIGLVHTLLMSNLAIIIEEPAWPQALVWGAAGAAMFWPITLLLDPIPSEVATAHFVFAGFGFLCGMFGRWGYREVAA